MGESSGQMKRLPVEFPTDVTFYIYGSLQIKQLKYVEDGIQINRPVHSILTIYGHKPMNKY
jgi:hypothetical protein